MPTCPFVVCKSWSFSEWHLEVACCKQLFLFHFVKTWNIWIWFMFTLGRVQVQRILNARQGNQWHAQTPDSLGRNSFLLKNTTSRHPWSCLWSVWVWLGPLLNSQPGSVCLLKLISSSIMTGERVDESLFCEGALFTKHQRLLNLLKRILSV